MRGAALAVLAALAAACAAATPAASVTHVTTKAATKPAAKATRQPAAKRTQVMTYSPFAPDGSVRRGFHVIATRTAQCSGSNLAESAYRCFLDQGLADRTTLIDPCYLSPGSPTELMCVGEPKKELVKVTTDEPPAANVPGQPPLIHDPWLIRLTDGQVCVDAPGAELYRKDIGRLDWFCPRGSVWGELDRSHRMWTARYQSGQATVRTLASVTVRPVRVTKVWF